MFALYKPYRITYRESQSLQAEYDSIGKEKSKTATESAYAEVISYNKKSLERELQNESRQQTPTKIIVERHYIGTEFT